MRLETACGLWTLVSLAGLAAGLAQAEPEPMARPTRPKALSNADDLQNFLNSMKNYYMYNGRARYGKRADETYGFEHGYGRLLSLMHARLEALRQNFPELAAARESNEGSTPVRVELGPIARELLLAKLAE